MTKGSSRNKKQMMKERILDITKEERTMERKSMSKYNRLSFFQDL